MTSFLCWVFGHRVWYDRDRNGEWARCFCCDTHQAKRFLEERPVWMRVLEALGGAEW